MAGSIISGSEIINLSSGTWSAHANIIGVGTAKLLISIEGGAFSDIEGVAFADTDTFFGTIKEFPDCRVRADTTGDSKMILSKINNR